jgi:hypothetical protein
MTLEAFINETLCPAGVVTRWEEIRIAMAIRSGDRLALNRVLRELCRTAGVELPDTLELPDGMSLSNNRYEIEMEH